MSTTKFYFGRIHFKHQLTRLDDYDEDLTRAERIRKLLWEYVDTNKVVYEEKNGSIQWVFGVCYQEDGYILGKFGKVYSDKPTTYDFDRGEFIEEGEPSTQADYSMFLIAPEKNLIIFNQRQHIGYRQFQTAFAGGYDSYVQFEDSLSIGLLQDAADIKELLDTAEIMYADFDLVPTNPTADPDMEVLDNHIRNMEADNFAMAAKSDGGINMDDDLMQAALAMSTAGYGNFEAEYERDDRIEHYASADKPASHEVDRPSRLEDLHAMAGDLVDRAESLLRSNDD